VKKTFDNLDIMVGTPVHGDLCMDYTISLLEFQKECLARNIPMVFHFIKSSLVTQGRQMIVSKFLKSKCSHLLFIDSDISFKFNIFEKMLLADKDIILTPYPVKSFDTKKAKDSIDRGNKLDLNLLGNQYTLTFKDEPNRIYIENGIVELTRGPAGFMLIKREVFTKLIEKYPNFIIKQSTLVNGKLIEDDSLYNFFDTFFRQEDNTYHGEDYYFCKLCTDVGIKIHGLIDEYITHHGDYGYKGRLMDELTLKKIEEISLTEKKE